MRYVWLPFFAKVLIWVLVFALASPVILPFYSGLQIGLVRPFVGADFALRLQPDGSIHVYYKNYSKPAVEREVTSFSGLGLLIALFLATPIPWRRRGKLLGLSALALLCFPSHRAMGADRHLGCHVQKRGHQLWDALGLYAHC
jgi:hypothetical protein